MKQVSNLEQTVLRGMSRVDNQTLLPAEKQQKVNKLGKPVYDGQDDGVAPVTRVDQ